MPHRLNPYINWLRQKLDFFVPSPIRSTIFTILKPLSFSSHVVFLKNDIIGLYCLQRFRCVVAKVVNKGIFDVFCKTFSRNYISKVWIVGLIVVFNKRRIRKIALKENSKHWLNYVCAPVLYKCSSKFSQIHSLLVKPPRLLIILFLIRLWWVNFFTDNKFKQISKTSSNIFFVF